MITIGRVYEKLESYEKDNYYLKAEDGSPLKPELIGEGWNQLLGDKAGSVEINEDFYKAMKAGENPLTGEQLIESGVNGNHRAGYDICLSPDKSFTILEHLSPQYKEIVDNIRNAAMEDTLKILEKDLIQVRMGQDGETTPVKTGNMIAMLVPHSVNRDGDPHTHYHLVVFNMSYNHETQKWQAIHSDAFKSDYIEKIFENQLAYHAKQSGLTVDWVKSDSGKSEYCRIAGIDQKVIDANSKRSIEIDKVYETNKEILHAKYPNASVGDIKQQITIDTRQDKKEMTQEQIKERFDSNLKEAGVTREQISESVLRAREMQREMSASYQSGVEVGHRIRDREIHAKNYSNSHQSHHEGREYKGEAEHHEFGIKDVLEDEARQQAKEQAKNEDKAEGREQVKNEGKNFIKAEEKIEEGGQEKEVEKQEKSEGKDREEITKEQIHDNLQTAIEEQHGKAMTPHEVIDKAVENLSDTKSVFSRNEIIKASMQISKGDVSIHEIEQAFIEKQESLIKLKESHTITEKGRTYQDSVYTTKSIQEAETNITKNIEEGKGKSEPIMDKNTIDQYLNRINNDREAKGEPKLTDSQQETIRFFMTNEDRVSAVNGWAGVGKTTIMPIIKDIAEANGYKIIEVTELNSAMNEMKGAGLKNARTVTDFLTNSKIKASVNDKTIILVDESSCSGSKNMDKLIEFMKGKGGDVSLWGDKKQLPGVAAGGSTFSYLIYNNKINYVQNTDIVRQITEKGREAVKAIYEGNIEKAMSMMEVHEAMYDYGIKNIDTNKIIEQGKEMLNPSSESGLKGGVFKIHEYVKDKSEHGFEYFKATNISSGKDTIIPAYEVVKNSYLNTSKNKTGTFKEGDTLSIQYGGMAKSKTGQEYQMFHISQIDTKDKTPEEIKRRGDELNRAGETKKQETMIDKAVEVYSKKDGYKNMVVVAETNKIVDELNGRLRGAVIEQGHLKGEGQNITVFNDKKLQGAERNLIRNYQTGDKLYAIESGAGVKVGAELTIKAVDEKRNIVTVEQTDRKGNTHEREIDIRRQGNKFSCYAPKDLEVREGEKVMFDKKIREHNIAKTEIGYIKKIEGDNITIKLGKDTITDKIDKVNFFKHGYSGTAHKIQGRTAQHSMPFLPSKAGADEKCQVFLVGATRHKEEVIIITDNKQELIKKASEYQVNKSTWDIIGEKHAKLTERELKREINFLSNKAESMEKAGKDNSEIVKKRDEAVEKLNTLKDVMYNQKAEAKAEGKLEDKTEKKIQDLLPDLVKKGDAYFRVDKVGDRVKDRQKDYMKYSSMLSEKDWMKLQDGKGNDITKTKTINSINEGWKHIQKTETVTYEKNGDIHIDRHIKNMTTGHEKHEISNLRPERIGIERISKGEHDFIKQVERKADSIEKGRASEIHTLHEQIKEGKAEEKDKGIEQSKDTKADQKQDTKTQDKEQSKSESREQSKTESKAEEKTKDKDTDKSKSDESKSSKSEDKTESKGKDSDRGKEDKSEEREQSKSDDMDRGRDEDSGRGRSRDIELSL